MAVTEKGFQRRSTLFTFKSYKLVILIIKNTNNCPKIKFIHEYVNIIFMYYRLRVSTLIIL